MKYLFLSTTMAVLLAGCGPKIATFERHSVYPVEGTVIWKQKPLVGARLEFHPLGWTLRAFTHAPVAVTGKDGRFHVSTYGGDDGAPVGKYTITIVCNDGLPGMSRPNILPARYTLVETSGLEVEIVEGANVLPPLDLGGKSDPEKKESKTK
jgi:hypothetical protein